MWYGVCNKLYKIFRQTGIDDFDLDTYETLGRQDEDLYGLYRRIVYTVYVHVFTNFLTTGFTVSSLFDLQLVVTLWIYSPISYYRSFICRFFYLLYDDVRRCTYLNLYSLVGFFRSVSTHFTPYLYFSSVLLKYSNFQSYWKCKTLFLLCHLFYPCSLWFRMIFRNIKLKPQHCVTQVKQKYVGRHVNANHVKRNTYNILLCLE